MVDVLYDIQLAQAIYRNNSALYGTDEEKDALIAGVLTKHKVSQADLDTSLVWYADNIKYYVEINDSVSARLRATSNFYSDLMKAADSKMRIANMVLPPFAYLNENNPTLRFEVDSQRISKIDLPNFHIRFDVQGVNNLQKLEAAVFYSYKDTLVKEIIPIAENKHYEFIKPELPDSLLKTIYGYVHYKNKVQGLPQQTVLYNISYVDSVLVSNAADNTLSPDGETEIPLN